MTKEQEITTDPLHDEGSGGRSSNLWINGYMRGLRRAHHGERFGTAAEHELWLAAAESSDPVRADLGRGYRAGLMGGADTVIASDSKE